MGQITNCSITVKAWQTLGSPVYACIGAEDIQVLIFGFIEDFPIPSGDTAETNKSFVGFD